MAAAWPRETAPPERAEAPRREPSEAGLEARSSEAMTRAFFAPVNSCSVTAADLNKKHYNVRIIHSKPCPFA